MNKLFLSVICISLFSLLACNESSKPVKLTLEKDFRKVEVDNIYSLMIPKVMPETDQLNDEASLQCSNGLKGAFLIVIDESKTEAHEIIKEMEIYDQKLSFVTNYKAFQVASITDNMEKVYKQSDPVSLKIDNLDAEIIDIEGKFDGFDLAYKIGFIEGKSKVYMIMCWTLIDRMKKHAPGYELSIKSFKLM
jgi:hypothetical protein